MVWIVMAITVELRAPKVLRTDSQGILAGDLAK
jgi:hypothetical protein